MRTALQRPTPIWVTAVALTLGITAAAIGTAIAFDRNDHEIRAGNLVYVSDSRHHRSGEAVESAKCPPGTQVVGGGGGANNDVSVETSFPFDWQDPNKAQDDGWAVLINGPHGSMTVYAVCMDK